MCTEFLRLRESKQWHWKLLLPSVRHVSIDLLVTTTTTKVPSHWPHFLCRGPVTQRKHSTDMETCDEHYYTVGEAPLPTSYSTSAFVCLCKTEHYSSMIWCLLTSETYCKRGDAQTCMNNLAAAQIREKTPESLQGGCKRPCMRRVY